MKTEYSVLMTVYRGTDAAELVESTDSMIHQTVSPTEIVIVADGPLTSEVDATLDRYVQALGSEMFRIVRLPENHGAGYASGIGVEACRCELIARMDSDDISDVTRIEKQLQVFEKHPEYAAVGCWAQEFITGQGPISTVELPVEPDEVRAFARRRCPVRHPCLLLRKQALEQAGGYRDIRFAEEWDIVNRMLQAGFACCNVPEALVSVRVGEDFYARRGGMQIAKRILSFKTEMFKNGQMNLGDYIVSAGASLAVCFMPNFLRRLVYEKGLRKTSKAREAGRCA